MRRSVDQAFLDLRQAVAAWAGGRMKPGIHIFVYPPAWEAVMLVRFPAFSAECAASGWPITLVDVGQGFLAEVERRKGFVDQLAALEKESRDRLLHDLGVIAERYLLKVLKVPLDPPAVARILVNTGALATFASYSTTANALQYDGPASDALPANVIAFPGEGDERSLNLLCLRVDTNYRIPRI
ncbi:MAG: hypothetical protein HY331_09120 [Chloroflexi bacterium]|nr:hypothetical protein [Chloroflexota bacterium]